MDQRDGATVAFVDLERSTVQRTPRHATSAAPHGKMIPRRLQLKTSRLSWPHSPQHILRKPCARMPHSRKAPNSSLTTRAAPHWCGFGLRDEAGRMLLHQAVQRGLLGVVALVVDRGAIRCPLGLAADLAGRAHAEEPARSQAALGAAIVPKCAYLRVPTFW